MKQLNPRQIKAVETTFDNMVWIEVKDGVPHFFSINKHLAYQAAQMGRTFMGEIDGPVEVTPRPDIAAWEAIISQPLQSIVE
jgi:hypothetical protein